MKSRTPKWEYSFMMCQRIGRPPISIMGLGRRWLSSEIRVPRPPARITAFIPAAGLSDWVKTLCIPLSRRLRAPPLSPNACVDEA